MIYYKMLNCRNISLEEDGLDWDELINESHTASFFQTKEWLQVWVKHFGSETKTLGVFDDKNLVGIAPFEIRENKVNFLGINPVLGGELVSDFGDIIAVSGREKEVWEVIIRDVRGLELDFIRKESPSLKILQELGGKVEETDMAPYIELPNNWDEYLASLDRHDRHELRRKMRKIETERVVLIDYQGDVNEIEEFFRLMMLGNEQKRSFLSQEMKVYFQDIIKTFCPDKLSLSFLKKEKDYLATALTFLFKDEVLLYNSGFDPKYAYLSPGLILKVLLIKRAIEYGKKRFDFLRGRERYKYDLGGVKRNLYKITF